MPKLSVIGIKLFIIRTNTPSCRRDYQAQTKEDTISDSSQIVSISERTKLKTRLFPGRGDLVHGIVGIELNARIDLAKAKVEAGYGCLASLAALRVDFFS
jgi:hypothetical protein